MAEFGIGSTNGIRCTLRALERKGYLRRGRRSARDMVVLRNPAREHRPLPPDPDPDETADLVAKVLDLEARLKGTTEELEAVTRDRRRLQREVRGLRSTLERRLAGERSDVRQQFEADLREANSRRRQAEGERDRLRLELNTLLAGQQPARVEAPPAPRQPVVVRRLGPGVSGEDLAKA